MGGKEGERERERENPRIRRAASDDAPWSKSPWATGSQESHSPCSSLRRTQARRPGLHTPAATLGASSLPPPPAPPPRAVSRATRALPPCSNVMQACACLSIGMRAHYVTYTALLTPRPDPQEARTTARRPPRARAEEDGAQGGSQGAPPARARRTRAGARAQ